VGGPQFKFFCHLHLCFGSLSFREKQQSFLGVFPKEMFTFIKEMVVFFGKMLVFSRVMVVFLGVFPKDILVFRKANGYITCVFEEIIVFTWEMVVNSSTKCIS
jgi:hypothetical protein